MVIELAMARVPYFTCGQHNAARSTTFGARFRQIRSKAVDHGLHSPDVPIFCPVYEVPEDAEDVFQPRKSRKANPAVGKTEPRQSTVDGARPRLDWQLRFPNVKQNGLG